MELRELEYFLAIAKEKNITAAAKSLHLSQPALTRQLKLLESELGTQLVIQGNRRLTLTEDGMMLRKRAEEVMRLLERTQNELRHTNETISGDIYICAGETEGVHFLTRAAKRLRDRFPEVRFHISSGDTGDVIEELDKGMIDFGLIFSPFDGTRYESLPVPFYDTWGVLMRKDSELARKERIKAADLIGKPLIVPRSSVSQSIDEGFLGLNPDQIDIAATYSLIYNASIMVSDGLGYALCLDRILNLTGVTELCFRQFSPEKKAGMNVIWKRYQVMPRAAQAFLKELQSPVEQMN